MLLAMILAFAPTALYPHYADLAHRPGGFSALSDQQIAAGIMWSAGDLPFGIAIALLAQGWLSAHEARTRELDELGAVPEEDPPVGVGREADAAMQHRVTETTIASDRQAARLGELT